MNNLKLLLFTWLALFAMSSCSEKEPVVELPKPKSVKFDASIDKALTRAFNDTWDAADAIGIYMKTAGGDLTATTHSGAENVKYVTVGGSGNVTFTAATAGIELPDDGSNVDFIAYYPYQTTINGYEYQVNVTSQNPPKNIDLLYSDNAVNQNKTGAGNVGLVFTHELAKIVINVTAGNGMANLSGLAVKVTGITPTATYALKDGSLVPIGSAADISLLVTGNIAEGIIVPGTTGDRKFVFEANGKTFTYDIPSSVTFTKRHKYTYNAVLSVDGVTMLNPGGTITDWTDAPQGTIMPQLSGGSGPEPGTPVEFFKELFGDGNNYPSGNRPKIAAMTAWSMTAPITYTDSYGMADIRSTTTVSPSVWFPATAGGNPVQSELVIEGIDLLGDYVGTSIKLSFDVAANTATSGNIDHLEVFYSVNAGSYVQVDGITGTFTLNNEFISITDISVPDGIIALKFFYDSSKGGDGYRLDNVVLTGIAP